MMPFARSNAVACALLRLHTNASLTEELMCRMHLSVLILSTQHIHMCKDLWLAHLHIYSQNALGTLKTHHTRTSKTCCISFNFFSISLLTHSIVLQGDAQSDSSGFGGQVIFTNQNAPGYMRVSGMFVLSSQASHHIAQEQTHHESHHEFALYMNSHVCFSYFFFSFKLSLLFSYDDVLLWLLHYIDMHKQVWNSIVWANGLFLVAIPFIGTEWSPALAEEISSQSLPSITPTSVAWPFMVFAHAHAHAHNFLREI